MQTWKDAWWLLRFEQKTYPISLWKFILMIGFGLFIATSIFTNGEEQATRGSEWILFFVTITFPYSITSSHVQAKDLGLNKLVSPFIAFSQTIAISKKTIATYRMCSYAVISFMSNSIFFILFYALSPYIRSTVPLETYIVFAIMFISYAIYAGAFQLRMETGYHFFTVLLLLIIVVPLIFLLGILLFYNIYTKGLVQWMLDLAGAYPIIVTLGSIGLTILASLYHIHALTQKMEENDY